MKTIQSLKHIRLRIILLLLPMLFSCKKFVQVDIPSNQIDARFVFTDDRTATSSVLGLYIQMMNARNYFISGGLTLYPSLSSDELYNTVTNTSIDPFTNNQLNSANSVIQNDLWRYAYVFIYQANACIEGLNGSSGVSLATKNQLLGEVYFIRAFCHFYLVNLFGDVPLTVSTDYRINESLPRTATTAVYDQIVKDLTISKSLLINAYPTTGPVRVNKLAASALLARVYLYRKDWINAEQESTTVIGSSAYSLEPNLNNVFLAGSKEAILQFIPTISGNNTSEGALFIPASATVIPPYALTTQLSAVFESADQRRVAWLRSNTVSGKVYNYPFKYKVRAATAITEYSMVLRLAEQYLIRAEARAQQNKITGNNSAESDINVIRNRAGLLNTTAAIQSTMLLAIEKERQTELFAEWGHRWFDLIRTGRTDAVLSPIKTSWASTAVLYPIPYLEIQRNPLLTQNLGY